MAEKDDTKAFARDVGMRSVGQLEAGLARLMAESGANSRWLLGALVLLNGGGIAVVAGQAAWLDPQAIEGAISFFAIGAALAVLAALGGALAALLLSRQIAGASALWTQVASSGELSEGALKAAGEVRRTGLVSQLATLGLGLLSLILFVAGAMMLASGLGPSATVAPEAQPGISVGTPPLPAPVPIPTATPSPVPTATPTPTPEPKATPTPRPEPRRAPRRAPRPAAPEPSAPSATAVVPPPVVASPPAAGATN